MHNNNTIILLGFQGLSEKYLVNNVNLGEKGLTVHMSTKVLPTECPKCGCTCHIKKDIRIRKLKHVKSG